MRGVCVPGCVGVVCECGWEMCVHIYVCAYLGWGVDEDVWKEGGDICMYE